MTFRLWRCFKFKVQNVQNSYILKCPIIIIYHNLSNIWVFSLDLFNIEFAENVDGNEEVCQRRGANLLLNGGHR